MGVRYLPRKLPLEDLVKLLVREHKEIRDGLLRGREAAARGDFASVKSILGELDSLFRQHIVDEESQILGLLVRKLGVKGAEREIAVFRQHRPIYGLLQRVSELASESAVELEGKEDELEALFNRHALAEESEVFPKAVSLGG